MLPFSRFFNSWLNIAIALLAIAFVALVILILQSLQIPSVSDTADQFKRAPGYSNFIASLQDFAKIQQSQIVVANVMPDNTPTDPPYVNPLHPWQPQNPDNIKEKVIESVDSHKEPVTPVSPATPVDPVTPEQRSFNKAQIQSDIASAEKAIETAAENEKLRFETAQALVKEDQTEAQTAIKRAEENAEAAIEGTIEKEASFVNKARDVKQQDIAKSQKIMAEN
jgi:hypothetical protein